MDLNKLRERIDEIDEEIIKQFSARMRVSVDVAHYKIQNSLPVYDAGREQRKLDDVLGKTDADLHEYMEALYLKIFELSRLCQDKIILDTEKH